MADTLRKAAIAVLGILLLSACSGGRGVRIPVEEGLLTMEPLSDGAIRIRVVPEDAAPLEELIFTEKAPTPKYWVTRADGSIVLSTSVMSAEYFTADGTIVFRDADGTMLLVDKGRSLRPTTVNGTPAYEAATAFDSPEGEHLYGTGQFQDGYLDVRGLTRRLTQVNTQISDHREKYVFPIISSTFVVHRTVKVCLHTNKQYC